MTFHESDPTPVEIDDDTTLAIEAALRDSEHGDLVARYEDYVTAKEALLEKVRELMCGEGESIDENISHVEDLVVEMSQSYAHAVLEFDHDAQHEIATRLHQRTVGELNNLIASGAHDNDPYLSSKLDEDEYDTFVMLLEGEDDAGVFGILEKTMGTSITSIIDYDLPDVPVGKNETKKARRDLMKTRTIEFTKDIAKIGLGTLAAGMILRKFEDK